MYLVVGVCQSSGLRPLCLQHRLSYERGLNQKTCKVIAGPEMPRVEKVNPNFRAESVARFALSRGERDPDIGIGVCGITNKNNTWIATAAVLTAPHRPADYWPLNERAVLKGQPYTPRNAEQAIVSLLRLVDQLCPLL